MFTAVNVMFIAYNVGIAFLPQEVCHVLFLDTSGLQVSTKEKSDFYMSPREMET